MFTIKVQDFGPIGEGTVTLRPLTVLIGPNNAGKSYFALLTHAVSRPFGRFRTFPPEDYLDYLLRLRIHPVATTALSDSAIKWLAERSTVDGSTIFEELPAEIKDVLRAEVKTFVPNLAQAVTDELKRGFAANLTDLTREHAGSGFRIWLGQSYPELRLSLSLAENQLQVEEAKWDISFRHLELSHLRKYPPEIFYDYIRAYMYGYLLSGFFSRSYYFPAARSGILQGHKALASSILSRVPLAGIEPLQIPTLSGVLVDFIGNVLRLERGHADPEISEVGSFLEERACRGKVDISSVDAKFEYPEIRYQIEGYTMPLHRVSSMVSEIVPIILFLKHVVQKEDLLIIEEPEAHLHPDSQRTLAAAIVKLVRLGVRLIITTHSEYLLHQISNFVRLSGAASKRRELGYSEDDYLSPAEVGAYLFCFDGKGGASHIEELRVTEQDGIPEGDFARIYEAIYDETLSIERTLQH